MTDYDKAFDSAGEMTDKELAGKLSEMDFDGDKLLKTFSGGPNEGAVKELIQAVNAAADTTAKTVAWTAFGVKVGGVALKVARKAILGGLGALLLCASSAFAGPLDLDPAFDWIKVNSKRSRAGVSVNLNGTAKGVAYMPLAWGAKRNYWDLGLGVQALKVDQARLAPGIGINLVALGHDALKNLLGSRIGLLPLPPVWIGPVIEGPDLNAITGRWDYKERVSFYLTYSFLKP